MFRGKKSVASYTLKIETAGLSLTMYQTTWYHIVEDSSSKGYPLYATCYLNLATMNIFEGMK